MHHVLRYSVSNRGYTIAGSTVRIPIFINLFVSIDFVVDVTGGSASLLRETFDYSHTLAASRSRPWYFVQVTRFRSSELETLGHLNTEKMNYGTVGSKRDVPEPYIGI